MRMLSDKPLESYFTEEADICEGKAVNTYPVFSITYRTSRGPRPGKVVNSFN